MWGLLASQMWLALLVVLQAVPWGTFWAYGAFRIALGMFVSKAARLFAFGLANLGSRNEVKSNLSFCSRAALVGCNKLQWLSEPRNMTASSPDTYTGGSNDT